MFEEFVLAASTADLASVGRAEHADAIEFRLDLATDPSAQVAAYDGTKPIIATNRAAWEGGAADGAARYKTLEAVLAHDAVAAVDIELAALTDGDTQGGVPTAAERTQALALRSAAQEAGVAVIASVHDFEATPDGERLRELLTAAAAEGDVGKLATTAQRRGDALRLLQATHEATTAGHQIATMAMGEAGRHTRAVAPLYGSRIGYAPVEAADATAPGQYPLATLRRLIDELDDGAASGG